MRSILYTADNEKFKFSEHDKEIYDDFVNQVRVYCGYSADEHMLFANILFLLTNKLLADYLLSFLEADIKQLWETEKQHPASVLSLHTRPAYTSRVELLWPKPTDALARNRSQNLLSRVLLKMEQRHGINTDYADTAPVPTFMGFVAQSDVVRLVQDKKLWNDDPKISGLFYHGKMIHRVQCYMLMKAAELGLLELDNITIPDLLNLLLTKYNATDPLCKAHLPWNVLLDGVIVDNNIQYEDPWHLKKLVGLYPTTIESNTHDWPYIYGCDPVYFHSYLMSVSRKNTPHLSECLTQSFCKSAFKILNLEREIGLKPGFTDYIINKEVRVPHLPITKAELTLDGTLHRQALCLNAFGTHPVDVREVIAEQDRTYKSKKIDRRRSFSSLKEGVVQYRLFKTPPPTEAPDGAVQGSAKRAKMV